MEKCYLYKITNNVNGKVYIGMTKNPEVRMKQHLEWSPPPTVSAIRGAVEKYGRENFTFTILCIGERSYIVDLEERAIAAYSSIENGYNIRSGGEDCGSGHSIRHRSDWEPVYARGFWFPNNGIAKKVLGITDANFYKWKREGTLGDVRQVRKDSLEKPIYVGGFWFDTITRASSKLRLKRKTIWARVKRGTVEQELRIPQKGKKADGTYSMTGRTGSKHHRSKAVIVHGVEYGSLSEAGRESGYTSKVISNRIKNNVPGFEWA